MRRGFSLIELMIVVAIIGILAAIAIPNYFSYRCRRAWVEAGYPEEVWRIKCKDAEARPEASYSEWVPPSLPLALPAEAPLPKRASEDEKLAQLIYSVCVSPLFELKGCLGEDDLVLMKPCVAAVIKSERYYEIVKSEAGCDQDRGQ